MKKFLAVLLSLVMACTICLPAFAADVSSPVSSDTIAQITSQLEGLLGKNLDQKVIAQLITLIGGKDLDAGIVIKILNAITKGSGSTSTPEVPSIPGSSSETPVRDALDGLSDSQRTNLSNAIEGYLTTDFDGNEYKDKDGNTTYNPTKVTAFINAMNRMDYADIKAVLDELHSSKSKDGTVIIPAITDGAYGVLLAEVTRQIDVSKQNAATAKPTEATTSAIDGVKNFLGSAFETIKGFFGGDSGDTSTTTKKATTTSKNGSSSTSKIPQTGDVALFSVAGVALAAGLALVLTKKKKDDK